MRGTVRYADGSSAADVMISDGREITRTGADGAFSIQPTGPFVFLTRPAGYTAEPWFAPAASDEVSFVLQRTEDVFPYRFVHVSDLHVSADNGKRFYPSGSELGSQDALGRFLRGLPERAAEVQSVIATGDLTDLGLDVEYAHLAAAVSGSPLPVHLLPGNHDHMAGELVQMGPSRTGYLIHGGDPAGYERNLGPRWFSFDLPQLHVVALDWHTHEIGLDNAEQDAWLRADLESVGTDVPWILLSHDQPWHSILDGLPSDPVATFSGHRHTSRVVRVGKTLHINTPTPLFAGLDYSPPSYRIVRWDGERIGLETRAIASTGLERSTFNVGRVPWHEIRRPSNPAVRWRHSLSGAGHRSPVRVVGDAIIAPVKREDEASGAVESIRLADGAPRWRAELQASVKGTPAHVDGVVVAVEVSGDAVGLSLADGSLLWRVPSPDPLRLFAWADPVVAGDVVVVGDLTHLRGLDPLTGELRWERKGLSGYQTLASQSNPVLVGDVLVLGNFPAPVGMAGFDPTSGETVWHLGGAAEDILGGLWPIGTPLYDEPSDSLYVPTPSGLVALEAGSGKLRWRLTAELPFSPATPASAPEGIASVFAGADVVLLDRIDGSTIWRTTMAPAGVASGEQIVGSELAMSSYTRTPKVLFAGPTTAVGGDGSTRLLLSGLDGRVYAVDATTGAQLRDVLVGGPLAGSPVVTDEFVITLGVDGVISAIERAALLS